MKNAALYHDTGTLFIPPAILNKPGALDDREFSVLKKHAILGAAYLAALPTADPMAATVAFHHHERWTGDGYPGGLCGNDIPLVAQIVGMADCLEALSSKRCYKKAFSAHSAVGMAVAGSVVLSVLN